MRSFGKVFVCLLGAVLLAVFAVSGYRIWEILRERQTAGAAYAELGLFLQLEEDIAGQDGTASTEETGADIQAGFPKADFDSLRSINDQVVGWIYDDSSVINYPIAQAQDNDYYLHHMFDGGSNASGCIFLDYRNQSDFSDSHCIIYGHHMKDGSMFAALSGYKTQEYYESHPQMCLLTPGGNYTIEVFAGYVANVEDDAWKTGFASKEDYGAWIDSCLSKSLISASVKPTASDRVITLSTCSYEFEDARFVLHGVLHPLFP